MNWLAFVAGAVLSWGVYGAMLHQGQVKLGSPMRALLCVGVAYFLIGVLVPVVALFAQGQGLRGFNAAGHDARRPSPARSARSARCASSSRSAPAALPTYVMPLVFGGAPLVNVLYTMSTHPPKTAPSPMLYVGFLVTAVGAGHGAVLQAAGLKYRTSATSQAPSANSAYARAQRQNARCHVRGLGGFGSRDLGTSRWRLGA